MPDTAPPDCGTCPDCGLYVSLVPDLPVQGTDATRWEPHQIPRCGNTERWCPNSNFELHNCAECSEPITKTMVHAVGHDDTRRHMLPTCRDLAREREAGHPASGRYRIDPRYGHTGSISVVELADSGVYEGAVPAMGFRPPQLAAVNAAAFDPEPEPLARVERERDRIPWPRPPRSSAVTVRTCTEVQPMASRALASCGRPSWASNRSTPHRWRSCWPR